MYEEFQFVKYQLNNSPEVNSKVIHKENDNGKGIFEEASFMKLAVKNVLVSLA